jgi:predicted cation transporter
MLVIYCFVYSLWISIIVFFTIFAYYIIIGEGISSSVIRRYTPNINKINTRLSRLIVLLKALNTICRTISLSILGNLIIII